MNLFIRTSIAPYRVDFYNALHDRMNMQMCFYHRKASDQQFSREWLESLCHFTPEYLKGIRLGRDSRKLCFGLFRLVVKHRPRVVIVPEFQFPLYQMLIIRFLTGLRFRVVSLCDDSPDMIESRGDFSRLHRFLRSFAPRLLDDIIVAHPHVRDWYREHFGMGIWMPIMMDENKARARYEAVLPLSREHVDRYRLVGRKVILFVGRFVALKRIDLLIEAVGRMREDVVLVLVGDGPESGKLQEQVAHCPKTVIFTGRKEGDSLYAWYNVADIFVLPSSQEAFGAVVNEALTAGARVVVSGHAGASCLVDKTNGEVFTEDAPESLAAALSAQLAFSEPFCGQLRPDLMPFRFEERIEELTEKLNL